ncbi:methyltransferase domain-containing protein [Acidisoma sp.]|uniref:methyltransferase domain-containing protein n=1 Tax=Acidisoma sp. TaxID=1872115 RepID=UPI003B006477
MDETTTSPEDYARCLADLETVNRITFTHRPTLRWLDEATASLRPGAPISILDVACGHGDLLRAIHRWSVKRGISAKLEGIDLNPRSAVAAALATPPEMAINWRIGDVFKYRPESPPDFIVSSQFSHHLDDLQVVAFLAWLERNAAWGWFVADLHRHAVPYYGFRLLARLMGWHPIVRYDGTISIARGFRRQDWERLTALAGVRADIRWHPMFRLCVSHLRQSDVHRPS